LLLLLLLLILLLRSLSFHEIVIALSKRVSSFEFESDSSSDGLQTIVGESKLELSYKLVVGSSSNASCSVDSVVDSAVGK